MSLPLRGDEEGNFRSVCRDLNIGRNAVDLVWQDFRELYAQQKLEGNYMHWLCCALYLGCRSSSAPTVGQTGNVQGNCVSLCQLTKKCDLNIMEFFEKLKQWAALANLSGEHCQKIASLERNFEVCSVLYKKFDKAFTAIFQGPSTSSKKVLRSQKSRNSPCGAKDLYDFCWSFFVRVKANYGQFHGELVGGYHLLLACINYLYANVLVADRRDLLNSSFTGLPSNFSSRHYKPPVEPNSIIDHLLALDELGNSDNWALVEVERIKTHLLGPFIQNLIGQETLKGNEETSLGILDPGVYNFNKASVHRDYEEYVYRVGEFDERIFSSPDAVAAIGTPTKSQSNDSAAVDGRNPVRRNLQSQLNGSCHLRFATPLTGRQFLQAREAGAVALSPISTATQNVGHLQALVSGRQVGPSDELLVIFSECPNSPEENIRTRVVEMGDTFCAVYANQAEEGSSLSIARKRFQLAEGLYYKSLESIVKAERHRHASGEAYLSGIFQEDLLHRLLVACCVEMVLFSYNSPRTFPWILHVYSIQPFFVYRVVEPLARIGYFPREVVKHLNHIEEQCLESLAWQASSYLWTRADYSVPSSEEASRCSQSLGLFFRKFYHLASTRLKDMCNRLEVDDDDIRKKVWTCFEFSIMSHTSLMIDRHLDQILMCAIYVIFKVTNTNKTFTEIMRCYGSQPNTSNHVYQSVLLLDGSRGDLIRFYNTVYIPKLRTFALKFSTNNQPGSYPLSPLPAQSVLSPKRQQLSPNHQVYVTLLKRTAGSLHNSPQPMHSYCFQNSPSKDLKDINVLLCQESAKKRALADTVSSTPNSTARKISF